MTMNGAETLLDSKVELCVTNSDTSAIHLIDAIDNTPGMTNRYNDGRESPRHRRHYMGSAPIANLDQ